VKEGKKEDGERGAKLGTVLRPQARCGFDVYRAGALALSFRWLGVLDDVAVDPLEREFLLFV